MWGGKTSPFFIELNREDYCNNSDLECAYFCKESVQWSVKNIYKTMAKKERKGYFYEEQEEAVKQYLLSKDNVERNRIFNNILRPAFTTMIESIIRRYNLHIPNEEFDDTFNDTISFLMSKIEHFNPEKLSKKTGKPFKAYSYCGTVCKNYLLHKRIEYGKELERASSYDEMSEEINDDVRFSDNNVDEYNLLEDVMLHTADAIREIMKEDAKNSLSEKEIRVGNALVDFMENWEDIMSVEGSNKLNKSTVLYQLREMTRLTTKEVRDSMKKYKKAYYIVKERVLREV